MELNQLLAFNQLVIDKPENEKMKLAKELDINYEEYKKRMVGKEKEADFIIILKSLDALKHFEAYDEGLSHITNEYTPDFKVELKDGYKMLIEVKHTDKEVFKISQGNLKKRIEFANNQKLPLRFAVSLKGIWGLFTTETLLEKRGRLQLEDFIGEKAYSWLDRELETCSYMFKKQIKIRSVYSTDYLKGMEIWHDTYGQLVSYELYYGDRRIFRAKGKNSKFIPYSIYLEALQDRVANSNQDIERNGKFTVITEYTDAKISQFILEYEFVLAPVRHMCKNVDSQVVAYSSQSAIADRKFKFLSVQDLRCKLFELVNLGLEIKVFKNNEGIDFQNYAEQFWNKSTR